MYAFQNTTSVFRTKFTDLKAINNTFFKKVNVIQV